MADGGRHGSHHHRAGGSALLRTHDADYYRRLALSSCASAKNCRSRPSRRTCDSIGYEQREPVEMVGEYSIRGGILDVFRAESARPLRIEFFGDEIESIRRFDVESQRSVLKVPRRRCCRCSSSRATGAAFPGWEFAAALEDRASIRCSPWRASLIVILDEPEADPRARPSACGSVWSIEAEHRRRRTRRGELSSIGRSLETALAGAPSDRPCASCDLDRG